VEHFADLTRRLADRNGDLNFAILGGAEDEALGRTIAQAAPGRSLDLTGKLSLPEMVEWIRLSELMVTNDTGPMHVAAALGKRVVAMFGPPSRRERALRPDRTCVAIGSSMCPMHALALHLFQAFRMLARPLPTGVFDAVRNRLA